MFATVCALLAHEWDEQLPASLGKLCHLESLWIDYCFELKTLPRLGLSKLQNLKIGRCGKIQSLPPSLGQLHALQTLVIEELAALEGIPAEVGGGLGALETLKISDCTRFKKLPTLEGLGNVKTFTLQRLRSLQEVPPSITYLTALQ